MSSINPHFTFNYSQPEEYRFSHDSIFLARRVFERFATRDLSSWRGLDLCAGCGVVGLDFLYHCATELRTQPAFFDFLELQEVYQEYFQKNSMQIPKLKSQLQFLLKNYSELLNASFANRYDLILSNPPFFHPGQGKMSPSTFKNRCRFFLDSDFPSLLKGIENTLKPQGEAFVLFREQTEHGWDVLEEARKILSDQIAIHALEDVRGTQLFHIVKK